MLLNLQLVQKITKFITNTKNNQTYFLSRLPIADNFVTFSTHVQFFNWLNFVEDINLDISNLKLATQKDTVLNTVKEFVKFKFLNINEILDPMLKKISDLKMIYV